MASPNLDQNKWYHLYVTSGPGQGLIGNNAGTGEKSGIWFNPTNLTSPKFRWQIFPFNSSAVVLRCLDAGENMYLSTLYNAEEEVASKTRPYLARGDIVDDSAFWTIEPWGDGTWYMWNADNGTDYHLMKKGSGLLAMSGDIAPPQAGQRWTFAEIDEINDEKFSSVSLRGAMTSTSSSASSASIMSSTALSSSVSSSTSSPSSTPQPDNGSKSSELPPGTKAAIGASVGGIGILLLIIVPLFFLRRRKKQLREHGVPLEDSPVPGVYEQSRTEQMKFEKAELHHDDAPKHEVSGKMIMEVAVEERPVELPGDTR